MTQMDLFHNVTFSQRDTLAPHFHLPGSAEAQKMTDISGRSLFQLVPRTPPTAEIGSGLLHTPRAKANQMAPSMNSGWRQPEMWPTPIARDYKGARKPETLKAVGRDAKNSLPDAVRSGLWPTPTANEDAAGTPNGKMQRQLGNHPDIRGTTPEQWKCGTLNPQWVEWLMGYPEGWTDLED